jgi:hypothetical protein
MGRRAASSHTRRQAGRRGLIPPGTSVADEATALLAMTAGLGNAVLAGTRSPEDARRVLAHDLDRLLGRPGAS